MVYFVALKVQKTLNFIIFLASTVCDGAT